VHDSGSVQLLDLACGGLLVTAVLVLWRRELPVTIRVLAVQGVALATLVGVLAGQRDSPELAAVAVGVLVLRAGVLPHLLRRALAGAGERAGTESRPLVNVAGSLLVAAVLTLLSYAVSRPLVVLDPSPASAAVPVGLTVALIGFFVLATRRRALSQLVGFLLMDNGITAVGLLTTSGISLIVELGVSLDVLLAVLVLRILTTRMHETFGDTDLDGLRELHD
jgi:hydrogenase-4 component E